VNPSEAEFLDRCVGPCLPALLHRVASKGAMALGSVAAIRKALTPRDGDEDDALSDAEGEARDDGVGDGEDAMDLSDSRDDQERAGRGIEDGGSGGGDGGSGVRGPTVSVANAASSAAGSTAAAQDTIVADGGATVAGLGTSLTDLNWLGTEVEVAITPRGGTFFGDEVRRSATVMPIGEFLDLMEEVSSGRVLG
jgi:hypothetical protein